DLIALEQGIGRKAHEVQLLAWVGPGGRAAWRKNLFPLRIPLRPEVGAPGSVQLFDRAVALLEPFAKRLRRDIAPASRYVTAVLVAHVPHGKRRVLGVALCHRSG